MADRGRVRGGRRKLRVHRKAYNRRAFTEHRDGKVIHEPRAHVPAATYTIEDRGKVGRTPSSQRWARFRGHIDGYEEARDEKERREAIQRAIRESNPLRVWRQLDQGAKLQKRINPSVSERMFRERDMVGRDYAEQIHRERTRER